MAKSISPGLTLIPIPGLPMIQQGDDLARLFVDNLKAAGASIHDGDIIVVAQKIISKAEGRAVDLADIEPSARARAVAEETDKDPRLVEVILSESKRVVRTRPGILIVEHRLGFIHANAGVDHSNVIGNSHKEIVLLLPEDPDQSAQDLRLRLEEMTGAKIGVLINDSMGRAWRMGTTGQMIGASGLKVLDDLKGNKDLFGRELETTEVGVGDELAAAASIVMGQTDEAIPAVIVRGASRFVGYGDTTKKLLRPPERDLFRS